MVKKKNRWPKFRIFLYYIKFVHIRYMIFNSAPYPIFYIIYIYIEYQTHFIRYIIAKNRSTQQYKILSIQSVWTCFSFDIIAILYFYFCHIVNHFNPKMVLIKLKKKTLITSQLIFYCFEKEWLYKIRYWLINNLNLNLGESNRTGFQDISYSLNNKYYKKNQTLWPYGSFLG